MGILTQNPLQQKSEMGPTLPRGPAIMNTGGLLRRSVMDLTLPRGPAIMNTGGLLRQSVTDLILPRGPAIIIKVAFCCDRAATIGHQMLVQVITTNTFWFVWSTRVITASLRTLSFISGTFWLPVPFSREQFSSELSYLPLSARDHYYRTLSFPVIPITH